MFCGTLILSIATPQAAGQSPEPEKAQTENVWPQLHFITGGPSGFRVQQSGSGMGTDPSFLKDPALPATPQQQIHFPGQQQMPATVPPLILPSLPNFPKIPIALPPQIPEQQNMCSVPLLRVQPDPSTNFTIKQAPAPPTDPAMVVKPLAPSCDEKTSVQKPGFPMPLPPNRR
jgi:hypothetical protein